MIIHYLQGTDPNFNPVQNLLVKKGQIVKIWAYNTDIKFAKHASWNGYPRNPNGEDEHGNTERATPNHPAPNCTKNSLVVRVGTGEFIQCGVSPVGFAARTEGSLYVTNNDDVCTDNEGYWTVNISVEDPPLAPPAQSKIDIHCHLFSSDTLVQELLLSFWNSKVMNTKSLWTDMENAVKWLAKILKWSVSLTDYNQLYTYQKREFEKSEIGANSKITISPLMMDLLYFCNSNNPQFEETGTQIRETKEPLVPPHLQQDFLNLSNKFKYDLINQMKNYLTEDELTEGVLELIGKIFEGANSVCINCISNNLTPGYKKHMNELEDIYYNNAVQGTVYPFLAVDPRRPKIFDLVKKQVDTKYGPFKGVKLYPPMGFVPTHPKMDEIFAYCASKSIPITVHTAPTGFVKEKGKLWIKRQDKFGNITDTPYDLSKEEKRTSGTIASNPDEWKPVFEKYNNLKVNFAHFGGDEHITEYIKDPSNSKNWTYQILQLMIDYKNVYCDISFVNVNAPEDKIGLIIERNPILNERLLFGTDYIMIMKELELGELRNYFNKYKYLPANAFASNSIKFLTSKS